MIYWPSTITYKMHVGTPFGDAWGADIGRALDAIDVISSYSFQPVEHGALLEFAPLGAVLSAFNLTMEPLAVNVTTTSQPGVGFASYVGLDKVGGWEPWTVVLHEVSHMFGTDDQDLAPGSYSLMGHQGPHPLGLTADVIEFIQQAGADDGDNEINVTGRAPGRVKGGDGDDTIRGSDLGFDVLYGNRGDDILIGAGREDALYGGQGADTLSGGGGNDVLYGNLGDDVLSGGDGNDTLYGGQGADVLYGGDGVNVLIGGLGADVIHADDDDVVVGFEDGIDTMVLLGAAPPEFTDLFI